MSYEVYWTKKIPLNAIIDPLGIRSLRALEDIFLPGITTQTHRIRYFTFLLWAWNQVKDRKINLLQMEKLLTLIVQYNHGTNVPYGSRNTEKTQDFLQKKTEDATIDLAEFTDFGVPGSNYTVGYGDSLYKNSLAMLELVGTNDFREIKFSEAGRTIANSLEHAKGKEAFFQTSISKKELKELHDHFCLCRETITDLEVDLWRKIFFGFTRSDKTGTLVFDEDKFQSFQNNTLQYYRSPQEWYEIACSNQPEKIALGRGSLLLMILRIIENAEPSSQSVNQTIRDAIYFKQFINSKQEVQVIDFGSLEAFRTIWEVYVHNLYIMSFLEKTFGIFLKLLEKKPMGTRLENLISDLSFNKLEENFLSSIGSVDLSRSEEILSKELPGKTTLKTRINERDIFRKAQSSSTIEEKLSNYLVLLCLLKHRKMSFSEPQLSMLQYLERSTYNLSPNTLYTNILQSDLRKTIGALFRNLINNHRTVIAERYGAGTKCWLLTEEKGLLIPYSTPYEGVTYSETKWRNVLEFLYDLKLVEKTDQKFSISEAGSRWLKHQV
ncbi:MAG: hypothetical protein NWE95_02495 [Candidatus Bathyarchaeota archaeon]|nr:hypothetical protein [Candidatus Bathyarchaeota archaeon]